MKNQIIHTTVGHNERWPRNGIMSVNHLLLSKGDLLIVKWEPIEEKRKINIEFETANRNGQSLTHLFKKEVENEIGFTVNTDGLHNLCIENPKPNEIRIGELKVFHQSSAKPRINPIPERYYKYEIKEQNNRLEKICTEWGYREDIGSTETKPISKNEFSNLIKFYDSEQFGFFDQTKKDNYVTTKTIIKTQLNELIAIKLNGLEELPEDICFSMNLFKINSTNNQAPAVEIQAFQSNEETIYFLNTKTYCTAGRRELGNYDSINIELFSNYTNNGNQSEWQTMNVYNTVFNRTEKEIKRKMPMDNKL